MKAFVIAVLLLTLGSSPWGVERAEAQRWHVDSTCLVLWFYGIQGVPPGHLDSLYNPDSVMHDTCGFREGRYDQGAWIKRGIRMIFGYQLPWAPKDSIIEFPWTAIDTTYPNLSVVKKTLSEIFDSVGPFVIRKVNPEDTFPGGESYLFEFRFFNYTPADSVYPYFSSVPDSDWRWFSAEPQMPANGAVKEQPSDIVPNGLAIYPQPASREVRIRLKHDQVPESIPQITDAVGRSITNFSSTIEMDGTYLLNVAELSPGFYFIRMGEYSAPFIVEPDR